MSKTFIILFLVCTLGLSVSAQVVPEAQTLIPGQPVEREIAGGQSHTYQISLAAGQFVRVVVEQKGIDVAVAFVTPNGKQTGEADFSGAFGVESFSDEATVSGDYRIVVRTFAATAPKGAYHLRLEVKAAATTQDKQRIAAERLLLAEATQLSQNGATASQETLEKLQQTLAIFRELADKYWEAYTLGQIGRAYFSATKYAQAIEYYEQALAILREVKNRDDEGDALNNLGRTYFRKSRYEKAIDYHEQALTIYREVKDRNKEGDALSNLGNDYRSLSLYEKAVEYHEQALAIYREVKNRNGEGITLNNLGHAYDRLGRYEKAIEYHQQALAILREMRDRNGEAVTLYYLGTAYDSLSQYERAIEFHEQALVIYREGKQLISAAAALTGLGNANRHLSRYEKAIEFYEQALVIDREMKNRNGEGIVLANLGNAYRRMSQYEKAIEYHKQALAIYREVKDRNSEGITLDNLGSTYRRLSQYEKAIEYHEQALAIYREVKDRNGEGISLDNLGYAYRSLGRYAKAIEYHEQALAIYREVKDRNGEGTALNNLGNAYRSLSRYEKAIEYHEQALAIFREVKSREDEADALYQLAKTESDRGNLSRARPRIEESLKIAESLRSDLTGQDSRALFLASVQNSYQLYIDLLMREHQAEPTQGIDALAIETSERARARSLLDMLAEARADVRQGVDTALLERERSLGRQLNDKAQRLMQSRTPEQRDALEKEISQLENDYERAQADIRKASPHYAALTQPQPLKLKEIQAQLDPDTLLLEYALGDERSYLWAISEDSLSSYELPKGELIEKGAREVHELLTARSSSQRGESAQQRQERIREAEAKLPGAAQSLSQILLAPVAQQLSSKRLVIVADGALQYIPFAMLPEPSVVSGQLSVAKNKGPRTTDNGQPLIVNHEVVSLPSASALAIQRAELAGRQPAPKMLAVIADPVFDRTDPRFKTAAPQSVTDGTDKTQTRTINGDDARSIEHLAENSGDKSGVTTVRMVIPRLPFTRQEASQLMALAPIGSSFSAIDFQASRATALDPALSQYRYVHIATHGLLDTERPGLSALVFSTVDAEGKPQNGFLRANDIYNLKLPAELVVLSACQTGLGKDIKGEGLVGLTRGFMYAGAARVVVSLWNVNDKATADLMTKFYEKILKQGASPAAALRAAQVEMWKQKQWQSPYYWAAFTMQGEWR